VWNRLASISGGNGLQGEMVNAWRFYFFRSPFGKLFRDIIKKCGTGDYRHDAGRTEKDRPYSPENPVSVRQKLPGIQSNDPGSDE
jgi:hypothetical protein